MANMIINNIEIPAGVDIIHRYKNGNIKIAKRVKCLKCSGTGIIPHYAHIFNGECFDCNGTGTIVVRETLMTPENAAIAEAKQRKREAEIAARIEQENRERERIEAEKRAEQERIERERAEAKAKSEFVGNVGDKIEMTLMLDHSAWWERPSFNGYGTDTMYVHIFKDDAGNTYTWKTNKSLAIPADHDQFLVAENGDSVTIKGTIKEHVVYDDEKQTVLTRCKVMNINVAKTA